MRDPALDPATEVFRLVGADRDDRLAGMFGGKSIVRTEWSEPADSDAARVLNGRVSKYPGSLNLDECDKGAELSDMLRLVFLLLVERSDGALEDLLDDLRSGMMTTGIPPPFKISRLDLPLDEVVLTVVLEARLRCLRSGILAAA